MLSVMEVKKRLPRDFIEELYNLNSPLVADKILAGMAGKRNTTLRVNTLKYNIQDLMRYFREINIKFERVSFLSDALVIKNATEKDIQKLDIYEKGYIYLQSLSSMIPPLVLGAKENEQILDMASAPGSKTTQISAMMNNTGHIIANELDKIRCERLKFNLNNQGATNVEVINGYGEKLGERYPKNFDRVLLDTPCSGEGRFIAEIAGTYRNWSLKTVKELSKIQRKLIKSGYNALKPGGIMVYSTCTLNLEENENILKWALENLSLKMMDIDLNIKSAIPGDKLGTNLGLEKAIKILPNKETEGFFIAKLRNMESRIEEAVNKKKKGYNCAQAVACTYCDYAGVDEETMFNICQAFGTGMGTLEGTCGAIVGAGVVLGMMNKQRLKTNQDIRKIMQDFKAQNSTVICKELKGIGTGKVLRECNDCVRDAARFLENIIEEKEKQVDVI